MFSSHITLPALTQWPALTIRDHWYTFSLNVENACTLLLITKKILSAEACAISACFLVDSCWLEGVHIEEEDTSSPPHFRSILDTQRELCLFIWLPPIQPILNPPESHTYNVLVAKQLPPGGVHQPVLSSLLLLLMWVCCIFHPDIPPHFPFSPPLFFLPLTFLPTTLTHPPPTPDEPEEPAEERGEEGEERRKGWRGGERWGVW